MNPMLRHTTTILAPCPECGSLDIVAGDTPFGSYAIRCACGFAATGWTREAAEAEWNDATSPLLR